ncbi:expressed unknown protein [Seminavis robusta]|uniref:Uncharacterized protein n=1 Tax=Seminavis robusta TaxID=568900 RepID=A0A9N8HKN7_9STRA|nr:expressed unknown protein [Seminavis robusta]|eukprot:Sro768_g199681.1  (273) ;mRNA; r:39422-40240
MVGLVVVVVVVSVRAAMYWISSPMKTGYHSCVEFNRMENLEAPLCWYRLPHPQQHAATAHGNSTRRQHSATKPTDLLLPVTVRNQILSRTTYNIKKMSENHHHQQSYGQNIVPLSGSVRLREEESENSSPEASRRRLLNGAAAEYEHPQVLCFAARNRRGRFYIPMTTNNFGGMPVNHVLFDSGCSSLLLPFPLQDGLPQPWLEEFNKWAVSSSRGTGAIHSPVLKIKPRIGPNFTCVLAGKVQPNLKKLRIHRQSSRKPSVEYAGISQQVR